MADQPESPPRITVAIVGGGMAGMTAAWELSRMPHYDIHVYEKSSRLGGKGASWRDEHGRIREHGLHLWLGFYENAFRVMKECYAEVEKYGFGPHADEDKRLAHGRFDDAFFPEPQVGVTGVMGHGADERTVWSGFIPPGPGSPGDPLDPESNPFTLASYTTRCMQLVKTLLLSIVERPEARQPGASRTDQRSRVDDLLKLKFSLDARTPEVLDRMVQHARTAGLTAAAVVLQLVTILEDRLRELNFGTGVPDTWLQMLEAVAAQLRKLLNDVVSVDPALRWKTEVIDIVITIAVGLYRDRVLFEDNGFDAINDIDYRDWLHSHGATRGALDSPFLRGIYELVFAYEEGDTNRPQLAAGVALRGALRMFCTHRGAMFWRMGSGMGDAVFAPLYKVLTKRTEDLAKGRADPKKYSPVTFHLMHSLRRMRIKQRDGKRFIEALHFKQSLPPEKALDHFGCWRDEPSQPLDKPIKSSLLKLNRGEKFDAVILGLGIEDLGEMKCGLGRFKESLSNEWSRMFKDVRTVATQSAQVWLSKDLPGLGWSRGPAVVSSLHMAFETWADMSHTLATERAWRAAWSTGFMGPQWADQARSVAYFCAPMPEVEVKSNCIQKRLDTLLDTQIAALWKACSTDEPARRYLAPMGTDNGWHLQANTKGSDRYTLSLPRTIASRISPLDASVANMSIAGDWTACGLDVGCIEAAVMSGLLAVHAISNGTFELERIVGYDHP